MERVRSLWGACAAMLVAVGFPSGGHAQETGTRGGRAQEVAEREPVPRTLCFRGAPGPACDNFLVVEMQGVLRLATSRRSMSWGGAYGRPLQESLFEDQLQWELGLMHNLGERWAVGGVARLGSGHSGALTGLALRGRRWLSDDVALDLSGGRTFQYVVSPGGYGRRGGVLGDARLTFGDRAFAGLRVERVRVDPFRGPGGEFDEGGGQEAVSVLLGLGSDWALGGSAAVGVWLLALLATVEWD